MSHNQPLAHMSIIISLPTCKDVIVTSACKLTAINRQLEDKYTYSNYSSYAVLQTNKGVRINLATIQM